MARVNSRLSSTLESRRNSQRKVGASVQLRARVTTRFYHRYEGPGTKGPRDHGEPGPRYLALFAWYIITDSRALPPVILVSSRAGLPLFHDAPRLSFYASVCVRARVHAQAGALVFLGTRGELTRRRPRIQSGIKGSQSGSKPA